MRKNLPYFAVVSLMSALLLAPSGAVAQTGSGSEPVRYVGGMTVHQQAADGQPQLAVGVESFQVMRANRKKPELADNFGWTYNRAPMLVYWNGRFYLEYLPNPDGAKLEEIARYQPGKRYSVGLKVDVARSSFSLSIDGKPALESAVLAAYVKSVERVSFRTGACRTAPPRTAGSKLRDEQSDVTSPNPDVPEPLVTFQIDGVIITSGAAAAPGLPEGN